MDKAAVAAEAEHDRVVNVAKLMMVASTISAVSLWGIDPPNDTFPYYLRFVVGLLGGVAIGAMASCAVIMLIADWKLRLALSGPSIVVIPFTKARHVLSVIFGKRIMNRVFDLIIGDVQDEWTEHFVAGRIWSARVVRCRGYVELFQAVLKQGVASAIKVVVGAWKLTLGG